MRLLVFLLALANLTLLGYILLDRSIGSEPERIDAQLNPQRIKLLTPQQVAALGPSKAAALPNVCLEWGPFSDRERERATAILEPFQLAKLVSQRRAEVSGAYWVYLPPAASRQAAEQRVVELRGSGLDEVAIVEGGENRNAIALGVFRTAEAAGRFAESLRGRGIANVQTGPRGQPVVQTVFVIRDPQPALLARAREAQSEFPGVEAKTGPCPEGN